MISSSCQKGSEMIFAQDKNASQFFFYMVWKTLQKWNKENVSHNTIFWHNNIYFWLINERITT